MKLTIVGCSDAFGSGGRYHSCYMLDTSAGRLMIDCGANSPLGLKRAGLAFANIDAVLITHCHGDHYGGLPFLFLDRLFLDKRDTPFVIIGPKGIADRLTALMESMYPSLIDFPRQFEVRYHELLPGQDMGWRGLSLAAHEMAHFSGSPSLGVRIKDQDKLFAFSGDSGWCENVVHTGRDADVYVVECTTFSTKTTMHLDYQTLATKFDAIGARRYVLTHMSEEMLSNVGQIDPSRCIAAEDGLALAI